MKPLVNVYRGDQIESSHYGSVVVADCDGRVVAFAGDPSAKTFLRSAAKPFQAIPLLEEGGIEEYDLTGEEIALICGSHGAEPFHVSTAAALLRKGDFDESDLLCGPHEPFDPKAARELRSLGELPSALHNNCSGKHAGFLLASRLLDVSEDDYIDPKHPLQVRLRQVIGAFFDEDPEQLATAIDGCSIPTFFTSLHRTAVAYARLAAIADGEEIHLGRFVDPSRRIIESMTTHPEYVGGWWSVTTPLIEAYRGSLVAKDGAEAFFAMGLLEPLRVQVCDVLGLRTNRPLGIALKVFDGDSERARPFAIARTLEALGVPIPETKDIRRFLPETTTNFAGRNVGSIRSDFRLEVL